MAEEFISLSFLFLENSMAWLIAFMASKLKKLAKLQFSGWEIKSSNENPFGMIGFFNFSSKNFSRQIEIEDNTKKIREKPKFKK